MSTFNCISNGCARVVWRPYQKGIRYRYSGEEWITINGDNYEIEKLECDFKVSFAIKNYFDGSTRSLVTIEDKIDAVELNNPDEPYVKLEKGNSTNDPDAANSFRVEFVNSEGYIISRRYDTLLARSIGNPIYEPTFYDNISLSTIEVVLSNSCDRCNFKVFKNNELIYEENRKDCPEIDSSNCKLSDTYEEIKIEKTPFLSAIDVLEFGHSGEKIKGIPFPIAVPFAIPDHCLNIYRFEIFDPLPDGEPGSGEPALGDFITQICSDAGCPRPEFEVICDCDKRSCPDGTCDEVCGTSVCCYNPNTGIVVEEIPISEYFPNNTQGA